MLTYAIGFIQNFQLACFAIVLLLMAAADRNNRSIRWLAFGYVAGMLGAVFQFSGSVLPGWIAIPFFTIAAPVGYACFNAGVVAFVRRGERTRWVSVVLLGGSLSIYIYLTMPWMNAHFAQMDRVGTLADFTLAVQTGVTAWLLLSTRDAETARPREVMGSFLALYAAVEFTRVAVYFATGHTPDKVAPWVEVASGVVYVVSCSVLPLGFIWMTNARLHAHMARQMTTDSLTQLLNRRGLENAGAMELARNQRNRDDFAVVLMDIDHFKRLNDTFGHAGGDVVLCETAMLFKGLIRDSDILGRLGGEEFVLLLTGTPADGAATLVEGLRRAMESYRFELEGRKFRVTASFGVTVTGGRRDVSWETLLREADQALYEAKDAGRNVCRFHNNAQAALGRKMRAPLQSELETAI